MARRSNRGRMYNRPRLRPRECHREGRRRLHTCPSRSMLPVFMLASAESSACTASVLRPVPTRGHLEERDAFSSERGTGEPSVRARFMLCMT